jgi:hypothetical protein
MSPRFVARSNHSRSTVSGPALPKLIDTTMRCLGPDCPAAALSLSRRASHAAYARTRSVAYRPCPWLTSPVVFQMRTT